MPICEWPTHIDGTHAKLIKERQVRNRFYLIIRDLHLYAGLFISPFVLVFAISVFYLVHAWVPAQSAGPSRKVTNLGRRIRP